MAPPSTSAEARALLDQAREFVHGSERSASEGSSQRGRDLRSSRQRLIDAEQGVIDALLQGLIPLDRVADAAELLCRSFLLHLDTIGDLHDSGVTEEGLAGSRPDDVSARIARTGLTGRSASPHPAHENDGRVTSPPPVGGPWATPEVPTEDALP